ncbi:hypothetical protein TeGR_g13315, partial [Tetraparma gracilis]
LPPPPPPPPSAEGYDHREALFGIPPYGGEISQQVYYSGTTMCEAEIDYSKGFPCVLGQVGACEPWKSPFILMVDRGDCTFVAKVRRAQAAGAAGVLIGDTMCQCDAVSAGTCTSDPGMACETFEPIMADDGSGADITVPSFLLFKQDADLIKAQLKQNSIVQVKMSWAIPAPDDRVEWEFWSSPSDTYSKNFEKTFAPAIEALGASQFFTPHYNIYDGVAYDCHNNDLTCGTRCSNHGNYCALDPDGDLEKGVSGADVVVETLRRLCIWQHYGADGIGAKWWAYTSRFVDECDEANFPSLTDTACADKVMKEAK